MIAKLKYYIYSICFDVKNFKFVREQLLVFLSMIGVAWFLFIAMSTHLIIPIMVTITLISMWTAEYFKNIFPHTTRAVEDIILRDKYPHMYKRFVDKE